MSLATAAPVRALPPQHAPRPPAACTVCGAWVPADASRVRVGAGLGRDADGVAVCGRLACRRHVMTLPLAVTCADCGRLVDGLPARIAGRCGTPECRALALGRERARAADALAAAARARLEAAARALRDADAAAGADDAPVVLLPTSDARIFPMRVPPRAPPPARLPRRRVRALRAHVRAMARLARGPLPPTAALPDPPPPVPAGAAPLLGAACAACGGRCCREGGERAYLTATTLLRWFQAHPGAGVRAAVAAYAAHLPGTSVRGSCVFHTAAGCALPRDMRSDTCNRYECEGLTELRELYAARADKRRPPRRVFLAVVEDGEVGWAGWTAGPHPPTPQAN